MHRKARAHAGKSCKDKEVVRGRAGWFGVFSLELSVCGPRDRHILWLMS